WRTTYIVAGLFIYFISWGMIRNTKMLAAKTYSYNSNPDFEQRLRQLFETKKVYLDASLNRKDVASHLGLSDHELSYHLGQHLQTSFTDFVNSYRIQEFQSRLEEGNSSLTLLGLALESGFGSKASFQRAFKKHTGQTPSTYKKKVQKII
ncbi:MAG: helix-turn-helix domain-containing protein, partial [Allomuricauda sp.]